jgi:hypothetical protein
MQTRTLIAAALITASFTAAASAIPITTFQRKNLGTAAAQTGSDILQTSDGGYIYVGTRNFNLNYRQITLTKTNAVGQPLWTQAFGIGQSRTEGLSIIESQDGGFVLGCSTDSPFVGSNRLILIKTDATGSPNAARCYDGTTFGRVRSAAGNGYVVVGTKTLTSGQNVGVMIRTDANLIQTAGVQVFQAGSASSIMLSDIAEDRDGSFYIAGRLDASFTVARFLAIRTRTPASPFGSFLWTYDYFSSLPGLYTGMSVVRDRAGFATFAGLSSVSQFPSASTAVCRVDAAGNRQWANLYNGFNPTGGMCLGQSDQIMLTCSIAPQDCGLIQLNQNTGTANWVRRFGDSFSNDSASRVIKTTDGGYASVGFQSGTQAQPMLYKHDSQGWIGCNQFNYSTNTVNSPQQLAITLTSTALGPDADVSFEWTFENRGENVLCFAQRCPGDYNTDQQIDFFDYLDFVADFSSAAPRADFNDDLTIDFFDYLDFVAAFSSPC